MKKVKLTKLSTREDAVKPQKEKYPDGTERKGLILNSGLPRKGSQFVMTSALDGNDAFRMGGAFITSKVTDVEQQSDNVYLFQTKNSVYRLDILEED